MDSSEGSSENETKFKLARRGRRKMILKKSVSFEYSSEDSEDDDEHKRVCKRPTRKTNENKRTLSNRKINKKSESSEKRQARLAELRKRAAAFREIETPEQRRKRLEYMRKRAAESRKIETSEQREARLTNLRERAARSRRMETPKQREKRLADLRKRALVNRIMKATETSTNNSVKSILGQAEVISKKSLARIQAEHERATISRVLEYFEQQSLRRTSKKRKKVLQIEGPRDDKTCTKRRERVSAMKAIEYPVGKEKLFWNKFINSIN